MKKFKSGFVTLIGRPNVGKSTLMNRLIGQKIAITSNKPQTTRNRIQTVYTGEEGQIIFLDTPGIHKAKNKLGEYMVSVAERTLKEVDVILWLVEPTTFIGAGERHIAEQLKNVDTPVVLVINKIDTVSKAEILTFISTYKDLLDFDDIVPVSALWSFHLFMLFLNSPDRFLQTLLISVLPADLSFLALQSESLHTGLRERMYQ